MREVDNEKWEKCKQLQITVQPYIVFVHPELQYLEISSYYVIINKKFYKLESPLKSVDICFKVFFAYF